MDVIIPGHRYALNNLKDPGNQILSFYMDPEIHGIHEFGTSCQEVIRALIDRVKSLDSEKPHFVNDQIIMKLREIIVLFEMRALMNKVNDGFEVENIPILPDGHIGFLDKNSDVYKALNYVHYCIDASDEELNNLNLTREQVLGAARDIREKIFPYRSRVLTDENVGEEISSLIKE